ncbi:hypothetical protein NI17_014465 [Thermobifida halotolerans]|uniref:Uncharacterized protein n=1 Tax=Thermobifida halotolerans TaxID=483545 RepID=A0A399G7S9_9ACTN|nr:hypothetical protein [Thermobifida halotolerans]UOE18054.1 hypothetical protein NI17_014465 [Thermobifida halotolerans]
MRLVFTNADPDTFDEYRGRFVRRVLDHGREQDLRVPRRALEELLDFKYGGLNEGGDGLLARWHVADVAALMLHWLPNRGGRPPLQAADVRAALDAWLRFLDDRGLLDERSDSPEELLAVAASLADPYREAIANPAEHRVGAYLHRLMDDLGYDVDDPEQVAEFEDRVADGEIPVDEELLAAVAEGEAVGLKPLVAGPGRAGYTWQAPRLLSDSEMDAAIEAAPTIARLRAQAPDELPKDSAEAWGVAFAAVGDAVAETMDLDEDSFVDAFGLDPDEFAVAILTSLFIEDTALPVSLLVETVAVLGEWIDLGGALPDAEQARFTTAVGLVLGELEKLGAVEREEPDADADPLDEPVYRLTPLGTTEAFGELSYEGYLIREFDELMAEDAEVLLERAAAGKTFGETDLDAWISARGAGTAMRELVAVARRTDDCTHRAAVRAVTAEHAPAARPAYEELRDDPGFGTQARSWLFDAGFLKESDLQSGDLPWVMLDSIAALARMDLLGSEQWEEMPVRAGGASLFDMALSLRHPETRFLLTWFGDNHPDPKVRKEARTTLHRFTSDATRRS